MTERRRSLAGRDQQVSEFGAILMRLCDALGAIGAALVDAEGETVDYAGTIDPFEIRIAAAELCVLSAVIRGCADLRWNESREIKLRGGHKSFYMHLLSEDYAMVVQLPRHAFNVSRRAVTEAIREISEEAGLELPANIAREGETWWRVDVRCTEEEPRRPHAVWVNGSWSSVEIIGLYAEALSWRERGYRARLETGAEITLIREQLGRWYADMRTGK